MLAQSNFYFCFDTILLSAIPRGAQGLFLASKLRAHSWQCTGDHVGSQGLNPRQPCTGPAPSPLTVFPGCMFRLAMPTFSGCFISCVLHLTECT